MHLGSGTYSLNLGYRCGLLSPYLAQPCLASPMTSSRPLCVCVLGEEGAVQDGVCEQGGVALLWAMLGWSGGGLK